jgi:hypothetical protein
MSGTFRASWRLVACKQIASSNRLSALLVEAADLDIKAARKNARVPLSPFGCVADYVPFYFTPRSPMPYKLAKKGVPTYTDGQDPLIYLAVRHDTLKKQVDGLLAARGVDLPVLVRPSWYFENV